MPPEWVRVRTVDGHHLDRHETDPGITSGEFVPIDGYPKSYEPRPAKYRTDSDGPSPEQLKGTELDAALDAAGLPKSGTADEKRARLLEVEIANDEAAPVAATNEE